MDPDCATSSVVVSLSQHPRCKCVNSVYNNIWLEVMVVALAKLIVDRRAISVGVLIVSFHNLSIYTCSCTNKTEESSYQC